MTTCRDTVADWRLFCRAPFTFSKLTWSTSVKKSIAPPLGKYNIASALSFHVIQYNNGCSWRASFPSWKSGVFCCHFFGDDPVVCRCRSPPPFDSPVNHPWIEMEVEIGSDILRELSRKIDRKKRQLHTMGNWRNKNNHNSSVLIGMIMPIDNHISPEEGQGFF